MWQVEARAVQGVNAMTFASKMKVKVETERGWQFV